MLRNKTILCFYNLSLYVLSCNKSQSVSFKIVSPGKYFRCLAKFRVKNKVQYYNINQHLKYLMIYERKYTVILLKQPSQSRFIYIIKSRVQLWENKITFVFTDIKAILSTEVTKENIVKKRQEWLKDTTERSLHSPSCLCDTGLLPVLSNTSCVWGDIIRVSCS